MWTTSSSRAKRTLTVFAAGVALGACLASCARDSAPADTRPPDAPMPAQDTVPVATPPPIDSLRRPAPVELRSVVVRRAAGDTLLERLVTRAFREPAPDPLVIDVRTEQPLARLGPSSSPEIYLNGERVGDTWMLERDRLVVFLPNRSRIRSENTVYVAWAGNEALTRSQRPLTFRAEQVPR